VPDIIVSEKIIAVPYELTTPQRCNYPSFANNEGFLQWALDCQAQNRKANEQLNAIRNLK